MNENDLFILKRMLHGFMPSADPSAYLADQVSLGKSLSSSGDEAGGVLAGARGAAVAMARGVSSEAVCAAFGSLVADNTPEYFEGIAKRYACELWTQSDQRKAELNLRSEIVESLDLVEKMKYSSVADSALCAALMAQGAISERTLEDTWVKVLGYYSSAAFSFMDERKAQKYVEAANEILQSAGKFPAISCMLSGITLWVNYGEIPVETLESVRAELEALGFSDNAPNEEARSALSGVQKILVEIARSIGEDNLEGDAALKAFHERYVAKMSEIGIEVSETGDGMAIGGDEAIKRLIELGGGETAEKPEDDEDDVYTSFLDGLLGDTPESE